MKRNKIDVPTVLLAAILWAVTFAAVGVHAAKSKAGQMRSTHVSAKGQ